MNADFINRTVGLSFSALPAPLLRSITGGRVVVDGNELDPQVQLLLALAKVINSAKPYQLSLDKARKDYEIEISLVDVPRRSSVVVRECFIPGESPLPARLYQPRNLEPNKPAPLLVFFHGGGWVLGGRASHDRVCRLMAEEAQILLLSVDYRLAPEHQFPAAYHDCYRAFRWACQEATNLGSSPEMVAVGGDSAGGNLSALVALRAKEEQVTLPSLQLLIYPATDLTGSFPSRKTFAKGYILEKPTMDWFRDQYIPEEVDRKDPRISPLFAKSHAGLSRAMLITAGYDPLRDEGLAYAETLKAAGVPVLYRCYPGMVHGFWNMGGVIKVAHQAILDVSRGLRDALRSTSQEMRF